MRTVFVLNLDGIDADDDDDGCDVDGVDVGLECRGRERGRWPRMRSPDDETERGRETTHRLPRLFVYVHAREGAHVDGSLGRKEGGRICRWRRRRLPFSVLSGVGWADNCGENRP